MSHSGIPLSDFLRGIFSEYKNNTNRSVILDLEEKKIISDLCDGIVTSLDLYTRFNLIESYSAFFDVLDNIEEHLWYSFVEDIPHEYFRVRAGTVDKEYTSLEMLHIPFDSRHLANTARFSLPGIPCTYMSTDETVAWYESGMPEQFYIAKYSINPKEYSKNKLLHLDINPLIMSHDLQLMILNQREITVITQLFKTLAKMFPLRIACSIKVEHTEVSFKEEYIIPQILMAWVIKSNDFLGIRYSSASKYEKAVEYTAPNIVIPAKEFDTDGYCKILKTIFLENSTPEVKFINIQDKLDKYRSTIDKIREFYAKVKYSWQTCKVPLPYLDIIKICQSIILNYDLLCKSYTQCSYVCINSISNLAGYADVILNNFSSNYGPEFSTFFVEETYQHQLTDEIRHSVQETLQEFKILVRGFLHDFFSFDFMMFIENTI